MTSKRLFSSVILCVVLFATSYAQNEDLDLLNQQLFFMSINDDIYFYDGQINLNNNDVIYGRMSVNHKRDSKQSVILITQDCWEYIPNDEIHSVVLFGLNNTDDHSETKFVSIENQEKLFRELYVKDSENAIYDLLAKPFDESVMSDIYVMEDNTLIRTYNFWHSGPKADLINYFKDRDNKNYKRRDFKSLDMLFAKL